MNDKTHHCLENRMMMTMLQCHIYLDERVVAVVLSDMANGNDDKLLEVSNN